MQLHTVFTSSVLSALVLARPATDHSAHTHYILTLLVLYSAATTQICQFQIKKKMPLRN